MTFAVTRRPCCCAVSSGAWASIISPRSATTASISRDTPAELKALAKDLLIGVTEFFREPEAWAVLEAEVIPKLVAAKHPEAPLRVWVTGCATGEEAYSLGMLLLERVASSERNGELQIFATDIDRHALEIARVGTYPEGMASSLDSGASYPVLHQVRQ